MARSFRRKDSLATQADINVTPLLDLSFTLLIIFMITTPLLEQTIPLNLPVVDSQMPAPTEQRYETISVNAQGHLYWGEERVTPAQLEERIQVAARQNPAPAVRLRGDLSIQYQEIVTVLHLLQKHKLSKINFDNTLR